MKFETAKRLLCAAIGAAAVLSPMAAYAVNCDTTANPITCSVTVAADWIAPTTREDGSPLSQNQIARYKLFRVRGASVNTVPAPASCEAPMCWPAPANTTADTQADVQISASKAAVIADGFIDLAFGIATQDTNSKWSEWSEVTYLRVDFPQEVISALTPAPKKMQQLNVTISFN